MRIGLEDFEPLLIAKVHLIGIKARILYCKAKRNTFTRETLKGDSRNATPTEN